MTEETKRQPVVLVVEDQRSMRKIIKTVLHHIGVGSVLEAADGAEGLNLIRARNGNTPGESATANPDGGLSRHRPAMPADGGPSRHRPATPADGGPPLPPIDLIVCDWMMPKMTGIDLLRNVRGHQSFKKLPFIMLTAENDREQILTAIEHGVTDYIVKPFTPKLLEEKLLGVISQISRLRE